MKKEKKTEDEMEESLAGQRFSIIVRYNPLEDACSSRRLASACVVAPHYFHILPSITLEEGTSLWNRWESTNQASVPTEDIHRSGVWVRSAGGLLLSSFVSQRHSLDEGVDGVLRRRDQHRGDKTG